MEKNYFLYFLFILLIPFLFYYSMTGKSVSVVNISIFSSAGLNFSINFIDFGPGSVYLNSSYAELDTRGNIFGGNWSPIDQGFILENIGNTELSVYLFFGKNASEFLGGTNPGYYYMVSEFEQNSCSDWGVGNGEWREVVKYYPGEKICNLFNYLDSNDSLRIDIKLVIPSDALIGEKEDILTVIGMAN